jgi:CheY-like chemotaxis protein
MRHVLLVEDNLFSQTIIADILHQNDLPGQLVCAGSAEEALRILPSLDPFVVLMDLTLPGMSGIEATRIIKRAPATKDIPVWAITARRTRFDIDDALAAGCDGYFTKPVSAKQLVEQLRVIESEDVLNLVQ